MSLIRHHIFWTILFFGLLLTDVSAQSSSARWALSIGGAGSRYNGTESQVLAGPASFFPSGKIAATRYLRPGFNFRTQAEFSPAVLDPLSSEILTSQYFSFQYAFVVKLNNGIILREEARVAPYVFAGAGGSYHATRPDAYSPFGGGISVRLGNQSAIQLEVNRNISWNKSPQVLSAGLNYVYTFKAKSEPLGPIEDETVPTEDIIASQLPADSDGDGVFDSQDDCPYDAGFIQNNGCPEDSSLNQEAEMASQSVPKEVDTSESTTIAPEVPAETEEDRIAASLAEDGLLFTPEAVSDSIKTDILPDYTEEVAGVEEKLVQSGENSNTEPCTEPGEISITFERGSSDLSEFSKEQLNGLAMALKECPEISLSLVGYADERRSEDDNLVLSIKRAFNVKYYLVYEHGISQRRIFSTGAGSDHKNSTPRSVSFSWSS